MNVSERTRYGKSALHSELHLVRLAEVSTRNDTLYRASVHMGQLIPGGLLTEGEVIEGLLDSAMIANLSEAEALSTIRSGMSAGIRQPRRIDRSIGSRSEALEAVAVVAIAADLAVWSGREGNREFRVLTGVIALAHQAGGPRKIALSLDRVRVTIGSNNRGFVHRGLRELVEDGWLRVVAPGGPGRATQYKLTCPQHLEPRARAEFNSYQPGARRLSEIPHSDLRNTAQHDAFRRDALDTTGWRVLRFLTLHEGWHRQSEVARATGLSRSTIWRWTKTLGPRRGPSRLAMCNLVEKDDRGRVRACRTATPEVLASVACTLGTAGLHEKDKSALRDTYRRQGWLSEDLHWIDQATGDHGTVAEWLRPSPTAP